MLENLVRLEYLLNRAEPHFEKSAPGSQVTLSLLKERLAEAKTYGTSGNPTMLQSTISEAFVLCATCHVQDRVTRRAFDARKISKLDDYLAVEYQFLTRDYASAISSSLNYFKQGERSASRDSIVLQRMLTIGVEVQRDLTFARQQLQALIPYLNKDNYNRARVVDWIALLERLQDDKDQLGMPLGSSLQSLDRYLSEEWSNARTELSFSQQEAYWVAIRGELNRHLKTSSNKRNLPKIYYWMAVTDRELQYRFHGSLSRAYLETCITEFPGHPYAVRCLDEYEVIVLISFSGSSGTHVPPEVNKHISELRKLIAAEQ